MKRQNWLRVWAVVLTLAFSAGMFGFAGVRGAAYAQAPTHHKNILQRHPILSSAAAGIAAYKIAKRTGHNRTMAGRKLNFAQRHPMLTGMAAAAVTHHYIKKSMKHR